MLDADLDQMLAFSPPHLSAYALMIEQGTRLGKQVELGRVTVPDDEQVATHFQRIQERLGEAGYTQYEVSNFAQPGYEAIHNTNYWRHVEYLGFGPSAHSFLWPSSLGLSSPGQSSPDPSSLGPFSHRFSEHCSGGLSRVDTRVATTPAHPTGDTAPRSVAVRWQTIRDLTTYLSAETPKERVESEEWLRLDELAEERITLGLRMREGVDVCLLEEQYHYTFGERQRDWIALQSSVGTFEWNTSTNTLRLTQEGLSLADHLTAKLLSLQ
jgi:Coproporphyrinogen III oxidase and related Fe-S oxidoreductases